MSHFDSESFAIPNEFINKFYNENLVEEIKLHGCIDPYKVQKLNCVSYKTLYDEHIRKDPKTCDLDKHRRAVLQTAFNSYQYSQELREYVLDNDIPITELNNYNIGYTNKFISPEIERKEFTAVISIHKECPPWYKPVGYAPGYDFRGKMDARTYTENQISLGKNKFTDSVLTQNKKTRFRFFIKYEFDESTFKSLLTILKACGIDNGEKVFQSANFNYKYIDLLVSLIKAHDKDPMKDISREPIYQYHECDSKCIVKELFIVPVNVLDNEKNIPDIGKLLSVDSSSNASPMYSSTSASPISSSSSSLTVIYGYEPGSQCDSRSQSPELHTRSDLDGNWRSKTSPLNVNAVSFTSFSPFTLNPLQRSGQTYSVPSSPNTKNVFGLSSERRLSSPDNKRQSHTPPIRTLPARTQSTGTPSVTADQEARMIQNLIVQLNTPKEKSPKK